MASTSDKERIAVVEEQVRSLRDENESLHTAIKEIQKKVGRYESLISITRGAVLVIMGFGAAVLWVFEKFYANK